MEKRSRKNDMRGIFSPVKRVSLRKNAAGAIMLLDGVFFVSAKYRIKGRFLWQIRTL